MTTYNWEFNNMVKEEVDRLRKLSNDEIAQFYIRNITNGFPMIVLSKAMDFITEERGITIKPIINYEIIKTKKV